MSGQGDDVVCAVDIGTSAVRAALITPAGHVVGSARRGRGNSAVPGQFDPDLLWSTVAAAVGEVTAAQPDPARVKAVAVAGFVGTVLLDRRLRPVVAGSDWSDTRGVELLVGGRAEDVAAVLSAAGRPTPAAGALPLLLWLRRHRPEDVADLRWVLAPKDFVTARLTGEVSTDATSAAYSLLLDVRSRTWADAALELAGLPASMLPCARSGSSVIGHVTKAAAAGTGLPPGIPVVGGGPDGTLGAVGLAGTATGVIVDIAGTTDVITTFAASPARAMSARCVRNPHPEPGWWAYGGPTGTTGGAAEWVAQLIGFPDATAATRQLESDLANARPGSNGVVVLPFLSGSRFPRWDAGERAAILGLDPGHRAADVMHAVLEAGAFAAREGIEELDPGGDHQVLLAGGVARSGWLAQLRADVLGRVVGVYDAADATLRGAAALATVGATLHPGLTAAVEAASPSLRSREPSPGRRAAFDDAYARWQGQAVRASQR